MLKLKVKWSKLMNLIKCGLEINSFLIRKITRLNRCLGLESHQRTRTLGRLTFQLMIKSLRSCPTSSLRVRVILRMIHLCFGQMVVLGALRSSEPLEKLVHGSSQIIPMKKVTLASHPREMNTPGTKKQTFYSLNSQQE